MRLFRLLRSLNNAKSSSSSSSGSSAAGVGPGRPPVIRTLFGKYLLLTNTLSAGLLMVAGDLAAQEYEYRAKRKKQQLLPDQERINWTRVGEQKRGVALKWQIYLFLRSLPLNSVQVKCLSWAR